MRDLECWAERYAGSAGIFCSGAIERQARYGTEWTDGVLEKKFSHYKWYDASRSQITYMGDKVRFQNGFGAWENYIYECDFDPRNDSVLGVRVRPGRI